MILIGDINCDYKKPKDSNTRKLKVIYSGYRFEQLIKDFTRVSTTTSTTSDTRGTTSLIDHLSSNRPSNLCSVSVVKIDITDHYKTYCITKLNAGVHVSSVKFKTESRSLKNYDPPSLMISVVLIGR